MAGKYNTFEELIRDHVNLMGDSNGWSVCYCEHCGDGKRTKGPRGGWYFTPDVVLYNCFNQGCEGSYVVEREHPLSNSMAAIMESFGVSMKEYKLLQLKLKQNPTDGSKKTAATRAPILTLPVPSHFYKLSEAPDDDLLADKAAYFLTKRKIDPDSYPFYLSTGKAKASEGEREVAIAKSLKNRLIIPAFRGDNMIYYQARDLDGKSAKKYLSPDVPRSGIIYGMDRLYENVKSPLFVTEGFFDSHILNGVATMENKLTSAQIELLNKSPRKKVIVPDRKGDSKRLAEAAIEAGYGISIPNWGDCKDVNDAVLKYGRLYVAKCVVDGIRFGPVAKMMVQMMK